MTMSADRERDRRSLQDLAKMAQDLTSPPSSVPPVASGTQRAVEGAHAKADDSGIVDLAAVSTADPGATVRAQSTPLASQGLFDDEPSQEPAPVSAPPSAQARRSLPAQPVPTMPPATLTSTASTAPASLAPAASPTGDAATSSTFHAIPEEKKKRGAVIGVVFGVVALGAAAAAGLFMMKSPQNAEAPTAAAVTTAEPAAPAQTATEVANAAPKAVETETAPAEATAAEAETADAPVTVADLAPEAAHAATTTTRGKVATHTTKANVAAKQDTATAKAGAPTPAKATEAEKELAAIPPSGPTNDLGAAMKQEVGGDAPKTPAAATTAAQTPTGNVPQKPSQGAVTGALGAVLPNARACLGPDDPISRASVVFAGAGGVQSVNVTGGAAGKPAEACIKGALMKAKVQPFAEPTYTANITVRHN